VVTGEIFVGYFEEDFRENIDHYIQLANKHFETKFEIHFEFRASLRIFQNLNFWDATIFHSYLHVPMGEKIKRVLNVSIFGN
jgi:hypothetical protein